MKILFVVDHLVDWGASNAIMELARLLDSSPENISIDVFAIKNDRKIYNEIKVYSEGISNLIKKIKSNNYTIIHWFRTYKRWYFEDFIKNSITQGIQIPIIMTLCQVPKSYNTTLSIVELKYINHFVFICKEALNHIFHDFLNDQEKSMIYFGSSLDYLGVKITKKNKKIHYGRGSSLNKCPKDMIETFHKLNIDNSTFNIAGNLGNNSFHKKILKLNLKKRIKFVGHLSKNEWIKFLLELDIFLYQLPMNSYSAIDYTIQHAMLNKVPVVLLGPKAPQELIENGKSGYIAKNKKEFIYYARQLANDIELRVKIGEESQKRIIKHFTLDNTISNHIKLYKNLILKDNRKLKRKIPFTLYILNFILKLKNFSLKYG